MNIADRIKAEITRQNNGRYQAFKMPHNDMYDGSWQSITEGSLISTFLYIGKLSYPLPLNLYPFWVILWSKKKEPFIKQIIEHNIEEGYILCHALNTEIKDFKIPLSEVQALYQVTHVTRTVTTEALNELKD